MTRERRVARLEKIEDGRAPTFDAEYFFSALKGALTAALSDYPDVLTETLAHLSSGHLDDAKDVLEHLTTGKENDHILTPRAVGGVIYLLLHGALDERGNIADRIREPLIAYCSGNVVLQDTIVLLLYDLTGDYRVFRDYPVAFACVCLNGRAFRIK